MSSVNLEKIGFIQRCFSIVASMVTNKKLGVTETKENLLRRVYLFDYQWIVASNADCFWLFIFPTFCSVILLSLYYILIHFFSIQSALALVVLACIFHFFIDTPHVFATYSRTYSDRSYCQNYPAIIYGTFFILFIGPIFISWHAIGGHIDETRVAMLGFMAIWSAYNTYHLIRQYWGISAIYSVKNEKDTSTRIRWVDGFFLSTGMIYPLIHHIAMHTPIISYASYFPISEVIWNTMAINFFKYGLLIYCLAYGFKNFKSISSFAPFTKILSFGFWGVGCFIKTMIYFSAANIWNILNVLSGLLFFFSLVAFIFQYILAIKNEQKINIPKVISLIYAVAISNVCYYFISDFFLCGVTTSSIHALQYLFIVYYYQKKQHQTSQNNPEPQKRFKRRNLNFIYVCVIIGSLWIPLDFYLSQVSNEIFHYYTLLLLGGIALHHYLLDSIIWKVRSKTGESEAKF